MTNVLVVGSKTPGLLDLTSASDWRRAVPENPAFTLLKQARRVLMLQGPVGPFFDRVAAWLQTRGCAVDRIVFQGGDQADCLAVDPIRFTGTLAEWPAFLSDLLSARRPDAILLFGQGRKYHKAALERARAVDLPVVVLEEGYFRPGFVTMELGGVNGYSTTLDRFEWVPAADPHAQALQPAVTRMHFQKMAMHATRHYVALDKGWSAFPHYEHHRSVDVPAYARYWARSWMRKGLRRGPDRAMQRWLLDTRQPYYFVPLQVESDSQVTQHSRYASIAEFIVEVMQSFARHAPAKTLLVFRQHPHARGGPGHHALIQTLAHGLGMAPRVKHLVEADTPALAQHSLGTVVINSTVGLQAMERGAPLIVMGEALYKKAGLAFMGALDDFWCHGRPAPADASARFLAQVKNLTQVSACVYALREEPLGWVGPGAGTQAGQ